MNVVALEQATDATVFGNKAAGLARLASHGLRVPPGFAIGWDVAMRIETWSETIRDEVRRRVAAVGFPVAVRSSALDEDSNAASFAGQYLTVLNVKTEQAVFDAIAKVCASAVTAAAEEYRRRLGIAREPRVAVVVQRLVPADVAGVCFTVNPVTRDDERLVSASWGLGEAVVQGLVVPDNVRMQRGGRRLQYDVGRKNVQVTSAADGATETVRVAADRAAAPCLGDADLRQLDAVATACEGLYGQSVDFEWAFHESELYVLQCRPVTT